MPKQNFKVVIEKDENGIFVTSVPALPGCHTQGKTFEEAMTRTKEAIELCLDAKKETPKKAIPQPAFIGIEEVLVSYA